MPLAAFVDLLHASWWSRVAVLGTCLCSLAVGAGRGFHLLSLTTMQFAPPSDSPSVRDQLAFATEFPGLAAQSGALMVVVRAPANRSVLDEDSGVRNFDAGLHHALTQRYGDGLVYSSYFTLKRQGLDGFALRMVDSPVTPSCMLIKLGLLKASASGSGSAEAMDLVNVVEDEVRVMHARTLPVVRSSPFFTAVTGVAVFSRDVRESTERDLILIDSLTFPLSMFVFVLVLGSFRFLVVPVLAIATVVTTSFHVVRSFAEHRTVTSLAPSIMMSASVAFSVDYSLFCLARLREEVLKGRGIREACVQMLSAAGHTVLISGLTLSLCWFMLCTFPVTVVSSVGLSVGVTTLICVAVNLLLTPALILHFPSFFGNIDENAGALPEPVTRFLLRVERRLSRLVRFVFALVRGVFRAPFVTSVALLEYESPERRRRRYRSGEVSAEASGLVTSPLLSTELVEPSVLTAATRSSSSSSRPSTPLITDSSASSGGLFPQTSSAAAPGRPLPPPPLVYESLAHVQTEMMRLELLTPRTFRLAKFVTFSRARALVIVVCLVLFVIPFGVVAWSFTHSNSFLLTIPRGLPGTRAFELLEQRFGVGRLNPYLLMVRPRTTRRRTPLSLFTVIQDQVIRGVLLNHTAMTVQTRPELIEGPMWMDGKPQSFHDVERCAWDMSQFERTHIPFPGLDKCRAVLLVASQYLTSNATVISVELVVEPQSKEGGDWLHETRVLLRGVGREHGLDFALVGGDSTAYDVISAVYDAFPRAVVLTSTCVFCLVATAFRSLVVPLRSISTIAMTLFFVYGAATLVYVHGALEWTGVAGLRAPNRALHWASPVMLFGVLVGLSLDYEIFLLVRVRDYRLSGFSDLDSIKAGLCASFGVISAAGGIMAIAFGGLILSDQTVLNQMSFFLCTAICFDTLVIRVVFVPAMMMVMGHLNWWPMEVPSALL